MELQFLKGVHALFHGQAWLNYIMCGITWLGEFGAAAILLAVVFLFFKKTRAAGFAAVVAIALDFVIVNLILKNAVNRPRPWTEWEEIEGFYAAFGVRKPTDTSFPSGHAAVCFAVAVAVLPRLRLAALPVLFAAILVAVSRIYLCVHYPSDVLGGILIGSACGVIAHFAVRFVYKKFLNKKSPPRDGTEEV